MKIIAARGNDRFIVEESGKYFLVDLMRGESTVARPPESPDIFLKSGGWLDVDESKLTAKTREEINAAMKNRRA